MKLLFLFLLLIPAWSFPLTVSQVQNNITSYFTKFKSYQTGFIMKTTGRFGNGMFKGAFTFQNGQAVYQLEKPGAMNVQMKKDGSVLIQNNKSDINSVFTSLESLYYVLMTNNFELKIVSEDAASASIEAVNTSGKKRISMNYNKTIGMLDSITYSGGKTAPAIDVKIDYDSIQGLPVFQQITAVLPSGRITLYLEDTKFELNP